MQTAIRNVLHPKYGKSDIYIEDGKIAIIESAGSQKKDKGHTEIDGTGYVMLPTFVDGHVHIDKTLYGLDWFVNDLGANRIDRITYERNNRDRIVKDPFLQSCRHIELSLSLGTLHMRSHVDVDNKVKVKAIEGALRAKEKYKDKIDLQIVALPQSGLMVPGTWNLVDEALSMGADLVGGIDPGWIERDPKGSVDAIFGLAEKHNKPIDIHLHEAGEMGAFSMELMTEHTVASGMQGMVTLSHSFCLGMRNQAKVAVLLEGLRKAEIQVNTGSQAYLPEYPSIKQVLNAGVNIAAGNDNVRDMWQPYGSGDMAERAMLIAMKQGYRLDVDLELAMDVCTYNGAKLMNLENYGTEAGNNANCVLMKARSVAEAVISHDSDRIVIRDGNVIAMNSKYLNSGLEN